MLSKASTKAKARGTPSKALSPGKPRKPPNAGKGRPAGAKQVATYDEKLTLAQLIKPRAQEIVDRAFDILNNSESDAASMVAAQFLTDRGWGKAVQGVEISGKDGEPLQIEHKFQLVISVFDQLGESKLIDVTEEKSS